MRVLESYVAGEWHTPSGEGVEVHDATTGEPVARVGSDGVDVAAALRYGREVGGPALRRLTFGQRVARPQPSGGGVKTGRPFLMWTCHSLWWMSRWCWPQSKTLFSRLVLPWSIQCLTW